MIPASVSGDVTLGGRSVVGTAPESLATSVGLVQQDPDSQICTLNVWQEVAFGPENLGLARAEVRARVERALDAAGIASLRDRTTTTLSGGEKQRLAIASILAMEPRVLLFDEPTANLDPRGILNLFAVLSEWMSAGTKTLVVVEHRIDALRALHPRLLLLDRGRLVERYPERERLDYARLGLRGAWSPAQQSGRPGDDIVSLDRVSFGYGAPLLQDLAFSLRKGEVVAILGPNGGGKTTLLRLLADLEAPEKGTIERADVRVGFVFQHPHHQLFERTVRQEMELGHPTPSLVSEELEAARLSALESAAPHSLSFGEQRRLAMATALARRPNVLLLDEPFSGQDRRNVQWMIDRIVDVARGGAAVAFVTHDIPLAAALADRVLYLDRGTWRCGTPGDVFGWLRVSGDVAFTPEAWS
jgi:energy-coupling factor transporter ATP-binding protein EcfA2